MNPVAVNMQCHSARRARATFTPEGVDVRVLSAMSHYDFTMPVTEAQVSALCASTTRSR